MAPRSRLKNRRYRERDMSGIANPHLGFPRRGLRTGSDPRINNTAGRRGWSPGPTVGQGIGPAGRTRPITTAEMGYNQSNIGSPQRSFQDLMEKWYQLPDGGTTEDTPMLGPNNPFRGSLTKSQRGEYGILNDASLTPEELENNRLGPRTLPAEQYQNPYFGQKQWNPDDIGGQTWDVDYTTEDITETERPPWDNWFGNLIRNLRGRNRGGLASLKYAR